MTYRRLLVSFGMIGLLLTYWIASKLPARAATHFDAAGRPNGWMDPTAFFWFMAGMHGLIILSFTAIPIEWMNIPHKSHWLAPERRAATEDYVGRSMAAIGAATQFLLMCAAWMVYDANIAQPPRLNNALLWVIVLYLVFTITWTVHFFRRFNK